MESFKQLVEYSVKPGCNAPPHGSVSAIHLYACNLGLDFAREQEMLAATTWPKLRESVRKRYGCDLQIFHSGCSQHQLAGEERFMRNILDEELRLSEQFPLKPVFVVFLGQKYANFLIPERIAAQTFVQVHNALRIRQTKQAKDFDLLNRWYYVDERDAEHAYRLHDPARLIPELLSDKPDVRIAAIDAWNEVVLKLLRLFRIAVRFCAKGALSEEFNTHLLTAFPSEFDVFLKHFLKLKERGERPNLILVSRRIYDLHNFLHAENVADFCDIDECDYRSTTRHFDTMFQTRLAHVTQQLRDLLFERTRDELKFDVLWKYPGGIEKRLHEDYLHNLSQDLYERLRSMIDSQVVHSLDVTSTSLLPDRWLPLYDFLWTTQQFLKDRVAQQTDQDEKLDALYGQAAEDRDSIVDQIVTGENVPYFIIGRFEERHETIDDVMLTHAFKRIRDAQPMLEEAGVHVVPLFYSIPPRTRVSRFLNLVHQHVSLLTSSGGANWNAAPPALFFSDVKHFVANCRRALQPLATTSRVALFILHAENLVEDVSSGARHRSFTATLFDDVRAAFDERLIPANLHFVLHACVREVADFLVAPSDAVQKAGVKQNAFLVDTYTHHDLTQVVRCKVQEAARVIEDAEWLKWKRYVPSCRSWQYAVTVGANFCNAQYELAELLPSFTQYLEALFVDLESRFTRTLVEHVCVLITLNESGVNDLEMVDVLSLDEAVLDSVLRGTTCCGVRRLPTHVWYQVKRTLQPYLLREVHLNGLLLNTWKSEEVEQFVYERYVKPLAEGTRNYSQLLAAYYSAFWYRRAKPIMDAASSAQDAAEAAEATEASPSVPEVDRYVPSQPVVYTYQRSAADAPTLHFNFRKIEQLPRHLLLSGQLGKLNEQVLFNYQWLLNKCKAISIDSVVEDLENTASRETHLLAFVLKRSRAILERNLDNLSNELIGFLLPYTLVRRPAQTRDATLSARDEYLYPNLRYLIDQCDQEARSCFLPSYAYSNLTVNYALIGAATIRGYQDKACDVPSSYAPKQLAVPDIHVDPERGVVYAKLPESTQLDVFDLRSGELLHTVPVSSGRLYVDAARQFALTVDCFQEQGIKLHALNQPEQPRGQLLSHVVPLNTIELSKYDLETKQAYHVIAFDVQRTIYCCVISSADVSYVCVGRLGAATVQHVIQLEGHYRAALCQITKDEQVLFCSNGDKLVSYDHLHDSACKSVSTVELQATPKKLLFLSDGQRGFVICENETKVVVVHSHRGMIGKSYKVVFDNSLRGDPIEDIQVSRNEKALLLRSHSNLLIFDVDKEIILQHLRRPAEIPNEFKLPNSNDYVPLHFTSASFALDDSVVVSSIFRDVFVWNAQTGVAISTISAPVAILSQLAVADLSVLQPSEAGNGHQQEQPCVVLGYNGLKHQLLFWNLNRAISEQSVTQIMDSLTNEVSYIQVCEKAGIAAAASIRRSDELGIFDLRMGCLTDLYTHEGKIEQVCLTHSADYAFVAIQARRPNTSNLIWNLRDRHVIAEFESRPAHFIAFGKYDAVLAYFIDQSTFGRAIDFELIGVVANGTDFFRCKLSFERQPLPIRHLLSPRPIIYNDEQLVFVFAEEYDEKKATYSNHALQIAKLPKLEPEAPPAELALKAKKLPLEPLLKCSNLHHVYDLFTFPPKPSLTDTATNRDSPRPVASPHSVHSQKDSEPTISFYLKYTRLDQTQDGSHVYNVDLALVTRREEDRKEVWRAAPLANALVNTKSLPVLLSSSLLFSNTGQLCVTQYGKVIDLTTGESVMNIPSDWQPLTFLNSDQASTTLILCSAVDPNERRLGVMRLADAMLIGTIDLHSHVRSVAKYTAPIEQASSMRTGSDRMIVCGCDDGSLIGFTVFEPLTNRNQRGDIVSSIASRGSLVVTRAWDKVDQSHSDSRTSSYARAPSVQRSGRTEREILHELPTSATPSGKSSRIGGVRPISSRLPAHLTANRSRSTDCVLM